MAITATPVLTRASLTYRSWNVDATADGDTSLAFNHGLSAAPDCVILTPLTAAGLLSTWIVSAVSATQITITKSNAGGSGAVPVQLKVVAFLPHSII